MSTAWPLLSAVSSTIITDSGQCGIDTVQCFAAPGQIDRVIDRRRHLGAGNRHTQRLCNLAKPKPQRLGAAIKRIVNCRSEEHTSELQSLMRISYAVFCLKKKKKSI